MMIHDRDLADWTDKALDGLGELTPSDLTIVHVLQGASLLGFTGALVWMFNRWGPIGMEKCKTILQRCGARLSTRGEHTPDEGGHELLPRNQTARGGSGTSISPRGDEHDEEDSSQESDAGEPDHVPGQAADD